MAQAQSKVREMVVGGAAASAAAPVTAPTKAPTEAEVKARVEAQVKTALDQAMARQRPEIAEPESWWNLFAIGPIQPISVPNPLLPHSVIKVGETAFVVTILFLNPFDVITGGTTPADVLSNFALPYEVKYQTGNLTTWTLGQADMNVEHNGPSYTLIPGWYTYVDVLGFTANTPGMYEMNISARILGAAPPYINAPQFAGFANAVFKIDPDLFFEPFPGLQIGDPIRFQIYP